MNDRDPNDRDRSRAGADDANLCRYGRRRHRGLGAVTLLLVGALAGAGVATAVGVAAHADMGGHAGAGRASRDGGHHGIRGERMKERLAWMLGAVDATPELRSEMRAMRGRHGELRRALVTELAGTDVDRAALEGIRGEFVASMDARSRVMVETLAGVAETLTPEQRAAIAERMARRGRHR